MSSLKNQVEKLSAEVKALKRLQKNIDSKIESQMKRALLEFDRMQNRPNNLGVYNLIKVEQDKMNKIRGEMNKLLKKKSETDYKTKMSKLVAKLKKSIDEIKVLNKLGNN